MMKMALQDDPSCCTQPLALAFGNANGLQSPMVRASAAAEQEEVGEPLVPGLFIGKAMTSGVSTQKKPLTYTIHEIDPFGLFLVCVFFMNAYTTYVHT